MKNLIAITALILTANAVAQSNKPQPKPQPKPAVKAELPAVKAKLSDDYAKSAIKYLTAVQNFELNATTGPAVVAENKIESAKDMEAAETTFSCDERVASVGSALTCPEHTVSLFLEITTAG
jgi:hypothetical protein